MNIYEHDETAIGDVDPRWTPILKGDQYCSPACGGCCKKSDYDKAVTQSNGIAELLGDGWKPSVNENLGWHWKVEKGDVEITFLDDKKLYCAEIQFKLEQYIYYQAKDTNPRVAVEKVQTKIKSLIKKIERQLGSISLDPIGIEHE